MSEEFEREVIDRLARIETKQERIAERIEDLEPRVSELEADNNQRKGRLAATASMCAAAGALVSTMFGRLM